MAQFLIPHTTMTSGVPLAYTIVEKEIDKRTKFYVQYKNFELVGLSHFLKLIRILECNVKENIITMKNGDTAYQFMKCMNFPRAR